MNILFTVSTYLPHVDGIQFVTQYLAEGLVKKGHTVDLVTYSRPDIDKGVNNIIGGVSVIRWDAKTKHLLNKGDKQGFQEYIINNQVKYDVIINEGAQTAFTDWMFPIMKNIKTPLVLYTHSIWDFRFYPNDWESISSFGRKVISNVRWGFYFFINKEKFRRYNAVIQLHEKDHGVAFFKNRYGIDCKIIENAADDEFFKSVTFADERENIIVNISNFNRMKNQKKAVDVFLNAELPDDWSLILVGSKENDYCMEVKRYAETMLREKGSKNRIQICTGLERKQIFEIVKCSSLFMTTSLREAFPISIIEAMAASVPFLSTDVGIVKYLPGGMIALNEADMIDKLKAFVFSQEQRIKFGQDGHLYALQNFRISQKVDQLEALLKKIIEEVENNER